MPEHKNFGAVSGGLSEQIGRLRQAIEDLISEIRASRIGPRPWLRFLGDRPVVLWLPMLGIPTIERVSLISVDGSLELTADEDAMAFAFEREAAKTPGWR